MPIFGFLTLAATVFCIVHAARSGKFWPWGYVIILLPGLGALIYLAFEVLPTSLRGPAARKARAHLVQTIDPARRYRALREELEFTDTIGNRNDLAQECLALGKYDEALELYDGIIRSPQGDEPAFFLGKARAQFGLDRPADALTTLDVLKSQWPAYRSQEGHLLYARAAEAADRLEEALHEYEALAAYYAGAEPRVRQLLLLDRLGRRVEAREIAADVVKRLERSPKFARQQQAEWLGRAKAYLLQT
jgi:hypothetical protein